MFDNPTVWSGIIRHVLTFVGGILVSLGWADEATATAFIGAVITVVGGVWSIMTKRKIETPAPMPLHSDDDVTLQ